ncbi:hypothetical protein [Paenibacillus gansuensis]|uniref:Uncharacterized protein n=1 Tax=Paenibacillus gansuensis TaxID=306542 RepID=A0ABW5PLL7_9BACL
MDNQQKNEFVKDARNSGIPTPPEKSNVKENEPMETAVSEITNNIEEAFTGEQAAVERVKSDGNRGTGK